MDPLSVSASILGILTAAGKVIEIVQPYVFTAAHAPQIAISVCNEVNRVRMILYSLRSILENVQTRPGRAAFIQVDQLIVMFTDGVLIFAELEGLLEPLKVKKREDGAVDFGNFWGPGTGIEGWRVDGAARMLWARKKPDINQVLGRLERFLLSLTAMLNIFQCESDVAATRSQEELETQMTKLLDSNQVLAARIRELEDAFNANGALVRRLGSVIQRGADEGKEEDDGAETETITDSQATEPLPNRLSNASATDPTFSFAFESDLKTSRVYRRAANNRVSLLSYSSSAMGSRAWSVFSGLSLADLSIISVIALPLYPADINNSEHYDFRNRDTDAPIPIDNATPDRMNAKEKATWIASSSENDMSISLNNATPVPDRVKAEDKLEPIALAPDTEWVKEKKTTLSRALMKANTAVLLDNAQNSEGAMEAYKAACTILHQVMLRTILAEDRKKLDSIRYTYARRLDELKGLVERKAQATKDSFHPDSWFDDYFSGV